MTLCWSLDKLGPMTRGSKMRLLVLQRDLRSRCGRRRQRTEQARFRCRSRNRGVARRLFPELDEGGSRDRRGSRGARDGEEVGMTPVEVSLPDWPYDSLQLILFAEGAAAFEELTLSGGLKQLKAQVSDAWPNCSGSRDSCRPSILCRPTGSAARSRGDGARIFTGGCAAGAFACVMRCSRSPISPVIRH